MLGDFAVRHCLPARAPLSGSGRGDVAAPTVATEPHMEAQSFSDRGIRRSAPHARTRRTTSLASGRRRSRQILVPQDLAHLTGAGSVREASTTRGTVCRR